jgi:hypothetical protein
VLLSAGVGSLVSTIEAIRSHRIVTIVMVVDAVQSRPTRGFWRGLVDLADHTRVSGGHHAVDPVRTSGRGASRRLTLLLSVTPSTGLTVDHVKAALDWARRLER